ncbi:hypothetical protein LR48_Vigan02g115500 [Vigna angularis]|uniref:Uncharacterized protein n=1 Tax=Phaseolus angularis TaxID=3914 RepID=A0A0L9TWU8_PHAAN|nr:hypothetical protein LR48_Vigan02g115500 [Vigna angularis]
MIVLASSSPDPNSLTPLRQLSDHPSSSPNPSPSFPNSKPLNSTPFRNPITQFKLLHHLLTTNTNTSIGWKALAFCDLHRHRPYCLVLRSNQTQGERSSSDFFDWIPPNLTTSVDE